MTPATDAQARGSEPPAHIQWSVGDSPVESDAVQVTHSTAMGGDWWQSALVDWLGRRVRW